ncbi:MAG: hopanoid C-3 methylase HpnR [Elusimicrobia bacterium]|nr:hopanoid C-3 methylase HpnR [Elusimicrobiota bacterium]
MRVLFVHPSALMYSEIYLRLEPLGLELVAEAARQAGHQARLLDLQAQPRADYFHELAAFQPEAVGFSLNYMANIPEALELARRTRERLPDCFLFAGGHSASFNAREILAHEPGAFDCVIRGDGEGVVPKVLEAASGGASALRLLPGVVTPEGSGPPPRLLEDLDGLEPARDLLRRRRKYFIGALDPCASIEFARGCPWDCSFCSAWTFYGRSYRMRDPRAAAEELARVPEPNVFIVDDVAFVHPEHGMAVADESERLGIRKEYYLETRADVLLRNPEVFRRWKALGLRYMFVGLEAIDDEGLRLYRKRVSPGGNFEALAFARSLGLTVAVNLIADPDWDERRFQVVREWALSVPEIVHLTVNTPYPGTETWLTDRRELATRDYRLFDVQHAVTRTRLPLERFYEELVRTQQVLNRKHLGLSAARKTCSLAARLLLRGQTNFVRMLWKFDSVYNPKRQLADHERPVRYALTPPPPSPESPRAAQLFVHDPNGSRPRTS